MSLILDKLYICNLEKYVGIKLKIIQKENNTEIIQDSELRYSLELKTDNIYIFSCIERGEKIKICEYSSELEMKRKLAISIRGFMGEKINYINGDDFENTKNIVELDKLMNLYIGEKYYSISNPQTMKINLEVSNNKYSIYLFDKNGEKIYKEENEEAPYVFYRFYSESLFYKNMLEKINSYEIIFNDILTEKEKYELY